MRIAILNSDYPRFLRKFYGGQPALADAAYDTQMQARYDSLVGMADFYSRNFRALGHEAREFYLNNTAMQRAWAREHGLRAAPTAAVGAGQHEDRTARLRRALQPYRAILAPIARRLGFGPTIDTASRDVVFAQIEDFAPDVILVQNIVMFDPEMVRAVRRPGRVIIAQHGVAPPEAVDLSVYDFAVSMLPHVLEAFTRAGVPAELVNLAFEASVLERMGPAPARDLELTFAGGIEAQFGHRIRVLEAICERFPIRLYLSGTSVLSPSSPIHKHQHGEVWGRDMYEVLMRSQITLNSHIDASRDYAGNMRMYEATGSGAGLLTDTKGNLATLFAPGREVATYGDIDDCLKTIERLMADKEAGAAMGAAGQRHTLAVHTYRQRAETLLALIGRHGERKAATR